MCLCSTPRALSWVSFPTHRTQQLQLIELTILPAHHWQRPPHVRLHLMTAVCVAHSNSLIFLQTTTPRSVFQRTPTSYLPMALALAVVTANQWATLAPTRRCRSSARAPRRRLFGRPEPDQPVTATA